MSPRFSRSLMVALAATMPLLTSPASAEPALRESTSLKWAPADAAFYGAALRNREQFRAVVESNAFRKIQETPMVAMGLAMFRAQWENPQDESLQQLKAWYEQPENTELVNFLLEALSEEVFVWGDESFVRTLEAANQIYRAVTEAQLEAIRAGQPLDDEQEKALAQKVVNRLLENSDNLQIPDLVIGFKIDDAERAARQVERLEEILREQLKEQPELLERLSREQIAGGDFLTWRLDGSLVPWEQLEQENADEDLDPETRKKLIATLKEKKLTLSIGVRDEYLLLSIGNTNEHLTHVGEGPLLIDRPELAPLRKFADEPLTSTGYVSEALRREAAELNMQRFEGMFAGFQAAIENPAVLKNETDVKLDEATRRELAEDLRKLREQILAAMPEQGAALGFSYLTSQGYEGYVYDWTENPWLDASQPLTILDHVGGSPLAFYAARREYSPETYDAVVHWLKRAVYYAEKIGLKELDDEQRTAYERFRAEAVPLLRRLDLTNRELLLPAFRDGQGAIVLDAKTKSKAWHEHMPPPDEPLPILELAIVYGVSDAAALKQAAAEYLLVAREVWEKAQAAAAEARQQAGNEGRPAEVPELPDFDVVYPDQRQIDQGELYYYTLPKSWGLDRRIAPNAALSEDFLVFSYLPKFSQRLLKDRPLKKGILPGDPDRPLASAAYFNFAGLIEAVEPWINYAIDMQFQQQQAQEEPAEEQPAEPANEPPAKAEPADDAGEVQPVEKEPAGVDPVESESAEVEPAEAQPAEVEPEQRLAPAGPSPEAVKEQVRFVLDLLKCYRGFASMTYQEGDAMVTRYQSRFQDLKE